MSTDINFLINTDQESIKKKKRIKIFNIVAFISLTSLGLISLILFLLVQAINVPSIKREQDEILQKTSLFQDRQIKLSILNNRIQNVQAVLDKRKNLSDTMMSILAKSPSRLSVGDLQIDDKTAVMTAQSPSLYEIGELINNLTDMARKKEVIKSLTLNGISFDEGKNTYQVSVKSDL